MYQVEDEPIETIHLYVVREGDKRPSLAPVFISIFALSILIAIGVVTPYKQPEARASIRVPAVLLPLKTFSAEAAVIPTGVKTYPAIVAHGILTITNGSVIAQEMPSGLIFTGNDEVEVITDRAVFVPAGSAAGYGITYVSAHALIPGKAGNIPSLDIDRVEGSSIYIRNLKAFTGGKDSYSIRVVTPQDTRTAIDAARASLTMQEAHRHAILAKPCTESFQVSDVVVRLFWACQYVTFSIPSYMRATSARLVGRTLLVDVVFVERPRPFPGK